MKYDTRNRQRIDQLADNTKSKVLKAYEQMVSEGLDIIVFETIRTMATQRSYVDRGVSKTLRSYHLVGQAIDIVPMDSKGNPSWSVPLFNTPQHKRVIKLMQNAGLSWGYAMWGWDMPHFQNDSIAYGSDRFTKGTQVTVPTVPTPSKSKGGTIYIQDAQDFANSRNYPKKASFNPLEVDGYAGPLSKNALTRIYQYFASVSIDGIFGPKSKAAANTLRQESTHQWWVRLLQSALNINGAKLAVDGLFGSGTEAAVRSFQRARGIGVDGIAGPNTWEQLFK